MLYSGEVGGLVYHLLPSGFLLQLVRQEEIDEETEELPLRPWEEEECHTLEIYRVDVEFVGGQAARVQPKEELPGWENFYNVGIGAHQPALFVKSYKQVRYEEVWNGVDVVFYQGERGELEYDFEIKRGVGVSVIRLRFQGGDVRVRNGKLVVRTPLGEIEQGEPLAWAGTRQVKCEWVVEGNEVGFRVEGRHLEEPLRIEPPITVQGVWGTYYGGAGFEDGAYSKNVAVFGNDVYLTSFTSFCKSDSYSRNTSDKFWKRLGCLFGEA
ncbi:MAG: hypothetical protein NZ933_05825 [Bacteroidia bacterium]|nr:hypothetical protein [Bacteroidia bacterium]